MAQVQRYNGNVKGVTNVDVSINGSPVDPDAAGPASAGVLISTGIGKHPTVYKLGFTALVEADLGVGGKVETALRTVQVAATTIAYQVNSAQLAVLVEATGWDDADLATALTAACGEAVTATSVGGLNLA